MDVSLFGALYRQERTRKNLTMDDITQKTGITKAFLSMLENGKVADIKLSNIEKLVGAIDYTPVQFLMLLERVEENGVFKKNRIVALWIMLQRGSRNESDCNVYGFIVFIGDLFWGSVMILGGLGVFVYARLLEGQ